MYLPYNLEGLFDFKIRATKYILGVENTFGPGIQSRDVHSFIQYDIKPILYPIEYVNNIISSNGEKFVPKEKLAKEFDMEMVEYCMIFENISNTDFILRTVSWQIIQKLIEWHLDVFGLIKQGFAIDKTKLCKK